MQNNYLKNKTSFAGVYSLLFSQTHSPLFFFHSLYYYIIIERLLRASLLEIQENEQGHYKQLITLQSTRESPSPRFSLNEFYQLVFKT